MSGSKNSHTTLEKGLPSYFWSAKPLNFKSSDKKKKNLYKCASPSSDSGQSQTHFFPGPSLLIFDRNPNSHKKHDQIILKEIKQIPAYMI